MGQKRRTQPKKLRTKLKMIRVKVEASQQRMVELLRHYAPNEIIAPGHISDFESGKREPNLIVLLAYSKLSNIPLNNIVDDELDLPEKLPSRPKHRIVVSSPSLQSKRKRD
jgi:transcriptional regulator with XRE-family HTH domain